MPSDSARKNKARRQQEATGESYLRAHRQLHGDGVKGQALDELPASASETQLLSTLGFHSGGTPDVSALWQKHQVPAGAADDAVDFGWLLRAPLGLQSDGSPLWMDLKAQSAGGSGPHGLMVGATGSGKTTVLQAVLFALCAQHSPDLLQVMLIGGKDEDTFRNFENYPHAVTLPGNTDYKAALTALMDDRAARLRATDAVKGGEDLNAGSSEQYRGARAVITADAELQPLPFVVVVVDEFSVLVHADPELANVIQVLMRTGRHLGIHVLAVTQPFGSAESERIAENAQYRVALRVDTAATSRRLIGSADASELPGAQGVGFYIPAPGADPVAFRGFKVSGKLVADVGRRIAADANPSD